MPDPSYDELPWNEDRRAIVQDMAQIRRTQVLIEHSIFAQANIKHELAHNPEYVLAAKSYIDQLEKLQSSSYFTRAYYSYTFFDRIIDAFSKDRFLAFASIFNIIGALLGIIYAIGTSGVNSALKRLIDFVFPPAHAAADLIEHASNAIPIMSERGILALSALIISQLGAFLLLGFSKHADSRRFAADFLKLSLGIYIGAAARIFV